MTSAQTMLTRLRCLAALACLVLAGCQQSLRPPAPIVAPYERNVLIGVAPIINESGVSIVDGNEVADILQREASQVVGFDVVSVNRIHQAMRQVGLQTISTDAEALAVMTALDLDGLLTGVITSWDGYRPLQLGLTLQLHFEGRHVSGLNPFDLSLATGEAASPGELGPPPPKAQSAKHFDASNHETLKGVREYADGRTEVDSAFGDDVYLVSMDLFTQYACHRLLADLIDQERQRLLPVADTIPSR